MTGKQEEQSTQASQDAPQVSSENGGAGGATANAAVVAKVEAMLNSHHAANPQQIAKIIHENPNAKNDIMLSVQRIKGNAYASSLIEIAHRVDLKADADEWNAEHKHDKGFKKKKVSPGYTQTLPERTGAALTRIAASGKLNLTKGQIWQLDQISNIETGGKAAAVDTTDDEVVSIGFDQLVLGSLSIQRMMEKVPGAFKKHGLELHPHDTYDFKSNPKQIVGAEHQELLRSHEWGDKFLAASAEDEVLAAMAEYAIQKDQAKTIDLEKKEGATASYWDDDTARAWITELYNSRPAFTEPTIAAAIKAGADSATSRDAFLDILSSTIISEYEKREPLNYLRNAKDAYKKAHGKKPMPDEEVQTLLSKHQAEWAAIGKRKATHIVTKIPRHVDLSKIDAGGATKKPAPIPTGGGGGDDHAATVHHDAPAAEHHAHAHHAHPAHHAAPVEHHDAAAKPAVHAPAAPAHDAGAHVEAAPAPETVHNEVPAAHVDAVAHAAANVKPHPAAEGPALHKVYKLANLPTVQLYTPPGGVKGAVEVFLFLHGKFAHHDRDPKPEESMHLAKAMAETQRNLVTLAPMASFGGSDGEWPLWSKLAGNNGYEHLIKQSIQLLQDDLKSDPAINVASISVAGHSAGGSAIGEVADQLGDAIHDITMEDGGYGGASFNPSHEKLVTWLLTGNIDKLLRVIVHGEMTRAEGTALKTHINPDHIKKIADSKGLKIEISRDDANADARTVQGMYLDHRLHIKGLGHERTVSVFGMPNDEHMDVRNKTTDHLIVENNDTEFAAPAGTAPNPSLLPTARHGHKKPAHHAETHAKHAEEHAAKAIDPKAEHAPVAAPPPVAAPEATHHDHAQTPAAPAPAPAPAPAHEHHATHTAHAEKTHSKHHGGGDSERREIGTTVVSTDLRDLQQMVANANNASVTAVANQVFALNERSKQLTAETVMSGAHNELSAANREEIVASIRTIHSAVSTLAADIDPTKLAAIKARMFRALQELSPYHEQAMNIDVLESNKALHAGGEGTRTCNVTSLGMSLESLGLTAGDYTGDKEKLKAAAVYFNKATTGHDGQKEVNGSAVDGRNRISEAHNAEKHGTSWDALLTLRLPDFLELAIIAHNAKGTSDAEIEAGAQAAWGGILNMAKLQELAGEFGASATIKYFNLDPHKAVTHTVGKGKHKHQETGEAQDTDSHDTDQLNSEFGKGSLGMRHTVEKLIDDRNRYEAETDPDKKAKLKATYDQNRAKVEYALTGDQVEKQTPLKAYARAVIDTIGTELGQGFAVETHVVNHFVRVRQITEEYVIIDDPSQFQRAHKKVTWEEARASGMFDKRLVISK